VYSDLQVLAQTDYALALASTGIVDSSFRIAEESFDERLKAKCLTTQARGYIDLGELYRAAGRKEAAQPLIQEGIRRLRDAGIQYMLLDEVIRQAERMLAEEDVSPSQVALVLAEANSLASRMGSKMKQLKVARLNLCYSSRFEDRSALVSAIEETFRHTQSSQNAKDRERSLRILGDELNFHEKADYANAIYASLGYSVDGYIHAGWRDLLSTDSHTTTCVLAVILAKEALG
jgi:hypothetical protein